jgi:hypothetical protein
MKNEFGENNEENALYKGQPSDERYQNRPVAPPEIVIMDDQKSYNDAYKTHRESQSGVPVSIIRNLAIMLSAEKQAQRRRKIDDRQDSCDENG